MARQKKLTNKFNIGDVVNMPMTVVGIKCYNNYIYYELLTDSANAIIFKIYDPDERIYPKTQFDYGKDSRRVTRIVEEDLTEIKNSSKKPIA